ncbi:response regulator [Stigmatella aurantiaca]|uniref:Response regulator n=1 Tax=Stigmatella aurantiaca (strain DW4/3-1) TaxID=378806 RepID=Q097T5_STIAD|nr:response regulator [Stigmatella aurantiaca]ADO68434.1 Response regulator [Stigmatella aurantiaca DW4/3-1]EAU68002.1 response regulator [Stigmatella aurantiaca DW4/3-1]
MKRLLIVDDEAAIIEALQELLTDEGYDVATAFNGAEGLKQLHAAKPDLLLLDLMMPVMDGRELLRRVREDPSFQDLPVVVMSAGSISDEERRTASATLAKPFELDVLLSTLDQQLRPKAPST